MKRKIGEIFKYNGEWYQCTVGNGCENCAFNERKCYPVIDNGDPIGVCSSDRRKDNKNVIFKKLQKVGEPYEFDGHLFQSYRTFEVPIFTENYVTVRELGNNSKISIEIKQTEEDMEEKKIQHYDCFFDKKKSNLKPFDIQKAKEGKPVCTRDGYKARIICFDAKGLHQPIIALVTQDNGDEYIETYYSNGRFNDDINSQSDGDLMMLPERKEGWVNVYKMKNKYIGENECNVFTGITVYKSEGEAKRNIYENEIYVKTIKVEWEE